MLHSHMIGENLVKKTRLISDMTCFRVSPIKLLRVDFKWLHVVDVQRKDADFTAEKKCPQAGHTFSRFGESQSQ